MIRINLAPPDERSRIALPLPNLDLRLLFGAAAVVMALGIGGYSWSLFQEQRQLAVEIETGARELNTFRTIVGPAAKMKEHLADLHARLKVIQALTRDQGRPLSLIDAFADAVPGDLWITALEEKGAILRVTGAAFSPTAVSNLMTALRASGRFKDVDIVVSKRDLDKTPSMVTFEVTCRFES